MRTELEIQKIQYVKSHAVAYFHANDGDQDFWEQVIEDYDDEIKEIGQRQPDLKPARNRISKMLTFVLVAVILTLIYLCVVGCTTVQGIGTDITWMGSAGQEMLEHGHESMEK